jgi:crossover junction endodeoxyribonuclease RusA
MDSVTFFVPGTPVSKGSLTRMPNGAMIPAGTKASRERFSNWRDDVRQASMLAMGDRDPSRSPIRLMAEIQLPYPVSSIRKYQMGWWPHVKKPDVDKLLRAILDPMKGIVFADDSQVVFCTVNKTYAWNDRPGAYVVIDFLDDGFMQSFSVAHRLVADAIETL